MKHIKNLPPTKTKSKLAARFLLNSIKHFELQETIQPNLKAVLRSHLGLQFSATGKLIIKTAFKPPKQDFTSNHYSAVASDPNPEGNEFVVKTAQ